MICKSLLIEILQHHVNVLWCDSHPWKINLSLWSLRLSLERQQKPTADGIFFFLASPQKMQSWGNHLKKIVTLVKCYFRDDATVIFKDTSTNYYLLLVLDSTMSKNLGSVKIAKFGWERNQVYDEREYQNFFKLCDFKNAF